MKKIFKKSMIALMVVLFSATLAMAASQKQNGNPGYYNGCNCECEYSPCCYE